MNDSLPKLEALEAIVFDFDGVILESAAIKGNAFQALFADNTEHLDSIRTHHLANLGVSRFDKFEWIYKNLFHRPLSDAEREELGRKYSELVFTETTSCPFVPGALELIERLVGRKPLLIASATPQAELETVVRERGLEQFFVAVHGSPPAKGALLVEIIEAGGFEAEKVLMIGDGVSDLEAANHAGCCFLARVDEAAPRQPFPAKIHRIRSLADLAEILF